MIIWYKNRMGHFIFILQCGSLQCKFFFLLLLFCQIRWELRLMICLHRLHWGSALIWVLWCWIQWGLLLKDFLPVGSVPPEAFPNTDYILRCFPVWLLWCWIKELCMTSYPQQSHSLGFGVLRGNYLVWELFHIKCNWVVFLFFPVWAFSSQTRVNQARSISSYDHIPGLSSPVVWVLMSKNSWKELLPFRVFAC